MYKKSLGILWVLLFCIGIATAYGEPVKAQKGPGIHLPEQQHTFDPVVEGIDVFHDFIVKNPGSADLLIERVQSG